MIRDIIHKKILAQKPKIKQWFEEQSQGLVFPFYASLDLRDSGAKAAPVDANLFPAGFNNICGIDQENIPSIAKNYLTRHYGPLKKVLLLAEEHTHNPYYWDNIYSLKEILSSSAMRAVVCVPGKNIQTQTKITSAAGREIVLELLEEQTKDADLIISNNDFSSEYVIPEHIPIAPHPSMGWRHRRKDWFFREYNRLAEKFSKLINLDPWHLTIKTELFKSFHPDDPSSLSQLKTKLDAFLEDLKPKYKKINKLPYAFLKNNSGTYGLGVTFVQEAHEVEQWNYKTRKKMKTAKGGNKITELILQEGISTILTNSNERLEPVIYMVGNNLVGGFLRAHKQKGIKENLNSPGAVYRKLCMSDLTVEIEGRLEENVYGWIAKLAVLALAFELKTNQPYKKNA